MHIVRKIIIVYLLIVPNLASAFLERPELKKVSIYKLSASLSKAIEEQNIASLTPRKKLEIAEVFLDTDKTYQALKILEATKENSLKTTLGQCRYYAAQARAHYARNYSDKAIAAAEKLVKIASDKCKPQLALAHAVLFLSFPSKKEYEKSMEQYLSFLDAAVIVGLSKNAAGSLKGIKKEIKGKKEDAAWYNMMARFYGKDGDTEKELLYLSKALKKDNEYMPALYTMAVILSNVERYEDSFEYYKKMLEIDPYYFRAQNGAGVTSYELVRQTESAGNIDAYKDAIQYLQRAIELDPEYPRPYNTLGIIHQFSGQSDKAIDYFKKAIAHSDRVKMDDPTYVRPIANLARMYADAKNYKEAIKYYKMALEKSPDVPDLLVDLGVIYGTQKKYAKALSVFMKALNAAPESVGTRLFVVMALKDLKLYDSAIEILEEGLELAPQEPRYYQAIAAIYTLQGRTKEADSALEKSRDLNANLNANYKYE